MSDDEEKDDGVNRTGLDYRAGYIEALNALLQNLQLQGVRCKKGEVAGLESARSAALGLRSMMIAKMKGQ